MFTTINEALDAVMARRNMTLGIDNLIDVLNDMGNPHLALKCIHIAGTNGKGSTTNYVRAGLQEAGYKVGSFTSPHLVVHNDRIRINNVMIDDERFLKYLNQTLPLWEAHHLSMFEIDMLISVLYFQDEKVDYVVYEVGLGGRLDATNVIHPLVCGITNIGMDHMNILGNTLLEIAGEKAGIFKSKVPIFTTETDEGVLSLFREKSSVLNAPLTELTQPQYHVHDRHYQYTYDGVQVELENQGIYQLKNSLLALAILKYLGVDADDIHRAILGTQWAGRFEEVVEGVYLDGAHNMMGVENLVQSMAILPRPWIGVFTALADKSHSEMIDLLEANFDEIIITEFDFYRAASAETLAENHKVRIEKDAFKAIALGKSLQNSGTLVVTGSLYFISEARASLLENKNFK